MINMKNKKGCGAYGIKEAHNMHNCYSCAHLNILPDETPCRLCKNLGCQWSPIEW